MKSIMLFALLSLCFHFYAITANPLFAITTKSDGGSSEPVLDTDGEPLRTDRTYYMTSTYTWGWFGNVLAVGLDPKCDLALLISSSISWHGLPLRFSYVAKTEDDVIRESSNLNIKFSAATPCNGSTVWRVNQVDENSGQYFISTGGVEGNSGPENMFSWFKIIKFGPMAYKLVFWPCGCDSCDVQSKDVGIYSYGNETYLVLSDQPFPFLFKKAK